MKLFVHLAVAVLATTSSALAGLTYDFTSTSSGMASQTIAGSVKAEGKSIRIDIATGDGMLFENGSFVVSSNGGQTMSVINPKAKTFYELDLAQLVGGADALLKQFGGALTFNVRNPKVSVTGGGDSDTIEGFQTKKSRVDSTYEIAVEGLGQPMVIRMQLATDVWWTDKVSSDFTNFLQMRGFRTGVEAVDKLIATEAGTIKGFPMKQITTTKVNLAGNEMASTSTSTVKNVRTAAIPPAVFAVPAGLTKTASPLERMMSKIAK
jgi:hypothetical protein